MTELEESVIRLSVAAERRNAAYAEGRKALDTGLDVNTVDAKLHQANKEQNEAIVALIGRGNVLRREAEQAQLDYRVESYQSPRDLLNKLEEWAKTWSAGCNEPECEPALEVMLALPELITCAQLMCRRTPDMCTASEQEARDDLVFKLSDVLRDR